MSEKPENPGAFPIDGYQHQKDGQLPKRSEGMSLRDYFASFALMGLISSERSGDWYDESNVPKGFAKRAFEYADAMLKARLL